MKSSVSQTFSVTRVCERRMGVLTLSRGGLLFRILFFCAVSLPFGGAHPWESLLNPPVVLPLSRKDLFSTDVDLSFENWESEYSAVQGTAVQISVFCAVDLNWEHLNCSGVRTQDDLPVEAFGRVRDAIFRNVSVGLRVKDLHSIFPQLHSLSLEESPEAAKELLYHRYNTVHDVIWPFLNELGLRGNELQSIPPDLLDIFPNLRNLDLSRNSIQSVPHEILNHLTALDLHDNPLDCSSEELEGVDRVNLTLLHLEATFCAKPPHQNKPKPILQTLRLIKKVKTECRVNCSCEVDYIWEQEKIIYSKTAVNCSARGFRDFPNPEDLPRPTDTLLLNDNHISSLARFVKSYDGMGIRNLYLENNALSRMDILETTDWIYSFQVLSLRNNNITDVPMHLLEMIIRENKWIYYIDLSRNDWKCDCRTVSTFKVWLLRNAKVVKNIDDVRCERRREEIRYLKTEDWCTEDEAQMIEMLDLFSIFLAVCILLVIAKVSIDYWNFKRYGKVPWIVSKM